MVWQNLSRSKWAYKNPFKKYTSYHEYRVQSHHPHKIKKKKSNSS